MQDRAEKLRQVIARYERLLQEASPELVAVYAAEIDACRAMLARIEQKAAAAAATLSSSEVLPVTAASPTPTQVDREQLE
jgi:hypothetical protein